VELRKKIIEVATKLFRLRGIRAVTMDDIAREGGMSKKTIYQEFKDKSQLVYEAFSAFLERDECRLKEIFDQEDGVIEHFIQVSGFMRERYAGMNPLILNEIRRYYPQSWKRFEEFKKGHAMKSMVQIMERGRRLGYFREGINVEILAAMRMEQITFDYESFPTGLEYSMGELQYQIFDHFIHGILTDKGRAAYLKESTSNN
jgi:AcrR family transcriptional regulator